LVLLVFSIFCPCGKYGDLNIIFRGFLYFRYGEERYEKRDLQLRVRQQFETLEQLDKTSAAAAGVPWHIVSAAQTIEQVQSDINAIVEKTLARVQNGKALAKLWEEGEYQRTLTPTTTTTNTGDNDKEN